jgi:tRNA(fMet)-specific endonuclease VapC
MPYLLDSNVWIHYLKQAGSPIHAKLAALQPDDIVTCSIVRSELLHGAEKYGNRSRRVASLVGGDVPDDCGGGGTGALAASASVKR